MEDKKKKVNEWVKTKTRTFNTSLSKPLSKKRMKGKPGPKPKPVQPIQPIELLKITKSEQKELDLLYLELKSKDLLIGNISFERAKSFKKRNSISRIIVDFTTKIDKSNMRTPKIDLDEKYYIDPPKVMEPEYLTEEEIKLEEQTIHDKYRKYITMYKGQYLRGVSYEEGMEILRWVERKVGHQIPMNFSCASCVMDLFKMFINME